MANLLALGIEQEGAHRWRSHIRAGCRSDYRWSDSRDTCLWEQGGERKKLLLYTRTFKTIQCFHGADILQRNSDF